jgi:carboxymethylenebutenolidase
MIVVEEQVELITPWGPMRTHIVRPAAAGKYPGIVFYSEIFQITGPIRRTATMLAGHGYVVAMPEIYHEFEAAGRGLSLTTRRGRIAAMCSRRPRSWPATTPMHARCSIIWLRGPDCTGQLGAMGICIGGHLAYRTALNEDVRATVCFYATDIHKHSLGKGMNDDSLQRASDIRGELLMIWGRQDPHIPLEGRMAVLNRLNEVGALFTWHEVNGAHAFLRDEGARYDPELARQCMGLALDLFHRKLGQGDLGPWLPAPTPKIKDAVAVSGAQPGEQRYRVVGDDGVYAGVGHFLPLLGGVGCPGGDLRAGLMRGGDLLGRHHHPVGADDLRSGLFGDGGEVLRRVGMAHQGVELRAADERGEPDGWILLAHLGQGAPVEALQDDAGRVDVVLLDGGDDQGYELRRRRREFGMIGKALGLDVELHGCSLG